MRVVSNWLQYFSVEALRTEVESCGLSVEDVLGDVAGAAFDPAALELAIIARR